VEVVDLRKVSLLCRENGLYLIGRNLGEWDKLAKWVINHKLISHNVRWLIQVPRLYEVFKAGGLVNNFEDVVRSKLDIARAVCLS
jgi:AMP deaminase